MKNKKSNLGSFATAKLQAKMRSILAIIALVAVIGFSMAACGNSNDDSSSNTEKSNDDSSDVKNNSDGSKNGNNGNQDSGDNGKDTPSDGTLVGTTVTDSNIGTNILSGVVFGDGKFVVNVNSKWSTSTDGVTWTTPTGTSISHRSIAYGGSKYFAGAIYSANSVHMWNSSDGITWTDIGSSVPLGGDINTIAYGDGTFVAGGSNGSSVVYSTDGTTWTAVSQAVLGTTDSLGTKRAVVAIAYGNGKFVAGGVNNIAYSSDGGITWTTKETDELGLGSNFSISAITYGGGKFVASGGSNGKMAYSSDGITWTSVENSPFPNAVSSIAYGGGKFVAGGYTGKMATSTDGITWTALPDSTFGIYEYYNCTVNAIAYGNSTFVAVGYTDGGVNGKMVCLK